MEYEIVWIWYADFENSVKAKEVFYANPGHFVSRDEFVKISAKSIGGI